MEIDAILCNHAEAVNNMLYISGGGVNVAHVPSVANPPYAVSLGIAVIATVPWGQTNQQHKVEIELLSEDGRPVEVPTAPTASAALHLELAFNVGRPANITIGDEQQVCLAANLPMLPMPAFGKYEFVVKIDGNLEKTLPFRLVPLPGAQFGFGPGLPGPGGLLGLG